MKQDNLVIDVKSISKRYRGSSNLALSEVSFQVNSSEVYGFLGANGAGKSTAIRTLLNFIQPTSGSATILNHDIVKDSLEIRKHIGYLAGDVSLYEKLTGREFLDYMKVLQPLKHPRYMAKLVKDFEAQLDKPIRSLSKGNKQKIGIIQALMHEPEVLILDEPTSGLDPLMQEIFFEAIHDAKNRGASVFFSSHNLAEIQRTCDRVGFIRNGRLIKEQSLADLANSAAHTFDILFTEKAPIKSLKSIDQAVVTTTKDNKYIAISVPASSLSQLFSTLSQHSIGRFDQREVNLEEEFLNYYREDGHHVK